MDCIGLPRLGIRGLLYDRLPLSFVNWLYTSQSRRRLSGEWFCCSFIELNHALCVKTDYVLARVEFAHSFAQSVAACSPSHALIIEHLRGMLSVESSRFISLYNAHNVYLLCSNGRIGTKALNSLRIAGFHSSSHRFHCEYNDELDPPRNRRPCKPTESDIGIGTNRSCSRLTI